MKKHLLLYFFLLLTSISLTAQAGWKCGTPPPGIVPPGQVPVKNSLESRSDTVTLYIPVTVNIIGQDNGSGYFAVNRVLEVLCRLQTDFEKHGFHFYLENLRYINSSAFYNMSVTYYGSDTMYQFITDHNTANTMNLYVVQSAQGSAFVSILPYDYALTHPVSPPVIYNGLKHALVIPKVWLGAGDHTITHEAGHYLGLLHTFNGWETIDYLPYAGSPAPDSITRSGELAGVLYKLTVPVERTGGVGCTDTGDFICDTPPDYLSIGFTCNANQESDLVQIDPSGNAFRSDGTFYMSYSNNACQNRFSDEQANWMRAVAQGTRNYLLYDQTPPLPFPPDDWALAYPSDQDTLTVPDSLTLQWDIPGADFYLLEFGRIVANTVHVPILKNVLLENNAYQVGITPGTKYYWKVSAVNKYYPCNVLTDTSYFVVKNVVDAQEADVSRQLLRLFPNPVSNRLYWRLPDGGVTGVQYVQVTDGQGRMLRRSTLLPGQPLDVRDLAPGVYALCGVAGGRVYAGRFVKL